MTGLRRRMIEDMGLHGLAATTQKTYLEAIKILAKYYKRSPNQLCEEEIRKFFIYLADEKRLARSTLRGYLFAIKFLYQKTLNRKWSVLNLIRVKRSKKLPVVLSPEEVQHLLSLVHRPVARMGLIMMYACGLRVSEATHLRPGDIDSKRMVVCVRNGKGGKDRQVPLPQRTLEQLRRYWRKYRPPTWLFPSETGFTPIEDFQNSLKDNEEALYYFITGNTDPIRYLYITKKNYERRTPHTRTPNIFLTIV